jgi:hypothetical protein
MHIRELWECQSILLAIASLTVPSRTDAHCTVGVIHEAAVVALVLSIDTGCR